MALEEVAHSYSRIEVLTHNEDIVRAIRDPSMASKEIQSIVKDILGVVCLLNYFCISKVPRCIVTKAHDLALKVTEELSCFSLLLFCKQINK